MIKILSIVVHFFSFSFIAWLHFMHTLIEFYMQKFKIKRKFYWFYTTVLVFFWGFILFWTRILCVIPSFLIAYKSKKKMGIRIGWTNETIEKFIVEINYYVVLFALVSKLYEFATRWFTNLSVNSSKRKKSAKWLFVHWPKGTKRVVSWMCVCIMCIRIHMLRECMFSERYYNSQRRASKREKKDGTQCMSKQVSEWVSVDVIASEFVR